MSARFVFLFLLIEAASLCQAELVTLEIQPGTFPDPSAVEVYVDAGFLLGDDEVTSSISGSIVLDLLPTAVNPSTIQIVDFNATVDDEVDFQVGFLPRVTIEADPGAIKVNMVEPGEATTFIDNKFSQLENLVAFEGTVVTNQIEDPIDLGEQEPTSVDFEDVSFSLTSDGYSLSSELTIAQTVPVDAGLLSLNIDIEVDGTLIALGSRPAALYELTSPKDRLLPHSFESPADWLRNGIGETDSLPTSIDNVLLTGSTQAFTTVDLGGKTQTVQQASFENLINLSNGNLEANDVIVQESAALSLRGNSVLTAESLTIEESATLLFSNGETHNISGSVDINGNVSAIDTSDEPGEFVLLTAGSITNVESLNERLTANVEFPGGVHLEDGLFATLAATSTQILFTTTQAIAGDTDGNGTVDFADFLNLSANFGTMGGNWTSGDFDGNGTVEFPDFLSLSTNFGQSQAAATVVPEPAAQPILLAGVIFFVAATRRKRLL